MDFGCPLRVRPGHLLQIMEPQKRASNEYELEKKSSALTKIVSAPDLKAGEIKDLDQAEIFLQNNGISHEDLREMLQDTEGIKKLVRRVDWMLMPLLCGTYLLQYIDKQSLSYAAVFDLFTSTNTNQTQYSWLISIFYFG